LPEDSTKVITCDGDIYCLNVPFDIFSELFVKYKNSFKGVIN
jgi:hypothetical protein